mgnify:FL=1
MNGLTIPALVEELRQRAANELHYADDLAKKIARDTAEAAEVRAGAAARLAMADEIEAACLADREVQDA